MKRRAGLTVSELKKAIADWPEINGAGEPTEVWLETGDGISNQCVNFERMNVRLSDDGVRTFDMLLSPSDDLWIEK
jgi:hypothetical protein